MTSDTWTWTIDTSTHTILPTLTTGAGPTAAAVSPDGRWVWVANQWDSSIGIVDVATRTVVGTIPLPTPPFDLAFSPDGTTVYATSQSAGQVLVLDVPTRARAGFAIPLPDGPLARGIAVSPDGSRVYVATSAGLFPIAVPDRIVGLPITGNFQGVDVTPDGSLVLAANLLQNRVDVVEAASWTALAPIPVGIGPINVAVSPDGREAYVSNIADSTVSVIDLASRTAVATLTSVLNPMSSPVGLEFTPDGREVIVADYASNRFSFIDTASRVVTTTEWLGPGPLGHGGDFITPPLVVPAAVPLDVAGDSALETRGFRRFVPFLGGTLRLTASLTTHRHLSVLAPGGTIDTGAHVATLHGDLVGPGALTKVGTGTLVVKGNAAAVPLTIAAGTLSGDGVVGAVHVTGGSLSPGDGVGVLHAETVQLDPGTTLRIELGGIVAGPGCDRVDASSLDVEGATLVVAPAIDPAPGSRFVIATNVTGTFSGLPEGTMLTAAGQQYRITYHGDGGDNVVLTRIGTGPAISSIAPQTVRQGGALAPVPFTVVDADGSTAALVVTATSSNPAIVGTSGLHLAGAAASRTIAATPFHGVTGETTITVTVSNGVAQSSTAFTVVVTGTTYLLAEGVTGTFFDTDVVIANPNPAAAPVRLTFTRDDGVAIVHERTLLPTSHTAIRVDDMPGLESAAFSTMVTSQADLPLVVERTVRWGESGYGAHGEKAGGGAGSTWHFAEGAQGFFHTYFLLLNPQSTANVAHVTYLREGAPPVVRDYVLAPASRTTIDAGSDAALLDTSFGARIVFDQPASAERTMYFGATPLFAGGTSVAGTPAPSTTWLLAEGATGAYFSTFVLLANPNDAPADVTLTYLPSSGVPVTRTATIPANGRLTRNVALEDASLADAAVATRVEASRPIVVERALYWGTTSWVEAHATAGVVAAGRRWGLADGRVGGPTDAQTYILLANPGAQPASTTITFLRENGSTLTKSFVVGPTSRFNVAVTGPGSQVAELADERFGAVVEATQPIVVERAIYSNAGGVTWAAGTGVTATPLP